MNATELEIHDALWLRLDAMTPKWKLKYPGIDFSPGNQAWARLTILPTPEPEFAGFGNGRFTRNRRLTQVDLFYPKSEKRTDLLRDRAEAVRALFWGRHGLALEAGQGVIEITTEPVIGPLIEDGASHLQLSVTIAFSTERSPGG